jgi:hypothetical protein
MQATSSSHLVQTHFLPFFVFLVTQPFQLTWFHFSFLKLILPIVLNIQVTWNVHYGVHGGSATFSYTKFG